MTTGLSSPCCVVEQQITSEEEAEEKSRNERIRPTIGKNEKAPPPRLLIPLEEEEERASPQDDVTSEQDERDIRLSILNHAETCFGNGRAVKVGRQQSSSPPFSPTSSTFKETCEENKSDNYGDATSSRTATMCTANKEKDEIEDTLKVGNFGATTCESSVDIPSSSSCRSEQSDGGPAAAAAVTAQIPEGSVVAQNDQLSMEVMLGPLLLASSTFAERKPPPSDDDRGGDEASSTIAEVDAPRRQCKQDTTTINTKRPRNPFVRPVAWDVLRDALLVRLHKYNQIVDENNQWEEPLEFIVFDAGVTDVSVLQSLLVLQVDLSDDVQHSSAIQVLAAFLSDLAPLKETKLACFRYLFLSDNHQDDQEKSDLCDAALSFCTEATVTSTEPFDQLLSDKELLLLWELRAVCLYLIELRLEREAKILAAASTAARGITTAAEWIHTGLTLSSETVSVGLTGASQLICRHSQPCEPQSEWLDRPSAVVALTYADAMRRATTHARNATARTVDHLRDASTAQLRKIPPLPQSRHAVALQAAGQVGLATLGAAAVVGDGVVCGTRCIAEGATQAFATVAEHKGGKSAGRVVKDVGESAGHVLQTVGHVTMLTARSPTAVGTMVAKNTGRVHVREQQQQQQQQRIRNNDNDGNSRNEGGLDNGDAMGQESSGCLSTESLGMNENTKKPQLSCSGDNVKHSKDSRDETFEASPGTPKLILPQSCTSFINDPLYDTASESAVEGDDVLAGKFQDLTVRKLFFGA